MIMRNKRDHAVVESSCGTSVKYAAVKVQLWIGTSNVIHAIDGMYQDTISEGT